MWFGYNCYIIFCRTCFSMGDLGVHVSVCLFIRPSVHQHVPWESCEFLHFFTDHFETLQMFSSWCEDVHMVWI